MYAVDPTDSASLLAAFGALGVLAVIFAESGLLVVGFLLPGDTLLFPAGVLCAASGAGAPRLALWQVLLCAAVGAVAGGQVGYLIGRHGGRPLLARTSRRRVRQSAARAEELLARYGYRKALVIGRFVPLLRSVLHPAAGALGVPTRTFTLWAAVGGVLWSQTVVLAGYLLGSSLADVDDFLLPMILAIVALSALPLLVEARRSRTARRRRAVAGTGDPERAEGPPERDGGGAESREPVNPVESVESVESVEQDGPERPSAC
ncbi:DedA family protein [Streptomyces sp. J2-1]|nr:DedA family protein [Streptomyces corallincola]